MLVNNIDDIWGADLVDMQEWSTDNKGYKYMLNVIDIFSKYAWCVPLKDKTGLTVLNALKSIVKSSGRKPNLLWVDKGKEFYNSHFNAWMKDNDIVMYSTYGEHKSVVVERFNRTLKEGMWKRFTAENTRMWIDKIDNLLLIYNNKKHSSIGMSPVEASKDENVEKVINKGRYISRPKRKALFRVDDKVRITRLKGVFEKGYLPNWSEEIFTISEVQKTSPVTYKLRDSLGVILDGSFYGEELQKTSQEVYRIEKVLRKKKINGIIHGLVKWMGYSDKHNQWIPLDELEKV